MISYTNLTDNFSNIKHICDQTYIFDIETAASTYTYYIDLTVHNGKQFIAVSENLVDIDLATTTLKQAVTLNSIKPDGLTIKHLAKQTTRKTSGFTYLAVAPSTFHGHLGGLLDKERHNLFLAIPVYKTEFSGTEDRDLFQELTFRFINILNWKRKENPRILYRFDNPVANYGTGSSPPVPVAFDDLLMTIKQLAGVTNGFVEVTNYRDQYCEIVPSESGTFYYKVGNKDKWSKPLTIDQLKNKIFGFITAGKFQLQNPFINFVKPR